VRLAAGVGHRPLHVVVEQVACGFAARDPLIDRQDGFEVAHELR
jgi:hypothetical protein